MYAVIATGGKQYRVTKGDKIKVEKLHRLNDGETIEFDQVLLLSTADTVLSGTPTVQGAKVVGKILGEGKEKKVIVFKKKRRKGYRRTKGHRQDFTEVVIEDIQTPS